MLKQVTSGMRLVLAACALALVARPACAAPGAEVSIVVVRALATGEPFVDPGIDGSISKRFAKLAQFKRFTKEKDLTQTVAWGEKASLALAGGSRFEATPRQGPKSGEVQLDMIVPGASQPCLETSMSGDPGRKHLVFCDSPSSEGTLLFFVSAKPAP